MFTSDSLSSQSTTIPWIFIETIPNEGDAPETQTLLALAFLVDMWKKDLISIADSLIFSPNQFHLNRCFAQLPPSILDQINIKTKVIYLKQHNSINREQNKQLNFLDVSKPEINFQLKWYIDYELNSVIGTWR